MELLLHIENLSVSVEGKEILRNFNLKMYKGQMHALMGRNGSGKTTLSHVLMGHPAYKITHGRILFEGEDIVQLSPDERAKKGIFTAFQYPVAVPGVTVASFIRESVKSVHGKSVVQKGFRATVKSKLKELRISQSFMTRSLNEGFSGGEKKRMEVLQLSLLKPKLCVLDEIDSGLDVDTLQYLTSEINRLRSPERSFLLITHYNKMINLFKPDQVHVLHQGEVLISGSRKLAKQIEDVGFEQFYAKATKDPLAKLKG